MDEPLTRARLDACFAELRADIRRALSIQTVVTIGGIGAIIVLAEALG